MSFLFAFLLLFLSIFVAWAGGNLFIRGMDAVGRKVKLSGAVAGLLIASVSTSSPELFVGVSSSLRGMSEVSLGDVLGSNIVNIALIFGVFLLLSRHKTGAAVRKSDVLLAAGAPLLVFILGIDGNLSQYDGALLLASFVLWVRWLLTRPMQNSDSVSTDGKVFHFAIGLAMLVVAGYAFTESARTLADHFQVNLFLLSAIIVALGTSMPELATTIVAVRKKHDAVAVGNLLGSNIFNSLGILGIVLLIHPISVNTKHLALPVTIAILATLLGLLARKHNPLLVGSGLILLYVGFVLGSALLQG
jgi:cation:H+ antiporter